MKEKLKPIPKENKKPIPDAYALKSDNGEKPNDQFLRKTKPYVEHQINPKSAYASKAMMAKNRI